MTLTREEMIQAEAAKRMIADPAFNSVLDRIIKNGTHYALFADEPTDRETHRLLVIAVKRIRAELEADAESVEADRDAEQLARAME